MKTEKEPSNIDHMQGKLKEEHNEEEPEETMTTKKQSKTKTSNVKDDIERQDQEKEDSKIKADQIASKALRLDHTLEELEEDKEPKFLSMDGNNQKIEVAKEEKEKEDIEDLDLVCNKPDHLVYLIIMTIQKSHMDHQWRKKKFQ